MKVTASFWKNVSMKYIHIEIVQMGKFKQTFCLRELPAWQKSLRKGSIKINDWRFKNILTLCVTKSTFDWKIVTFFVQ